MLVCYRTLATAFAQIRVHGFSRCSDFVVPTSVKSFCCGGNNPHPYRRQARKMRPTAVLLLLAAAAGAGDVEERVATIVASLTREEKLNLLNGVGWDQWDIRDGYYVGGSAQIARHRRRRGGLTG